MSVSRIEVISISIMLGVRAHPKRGKRRTPISYPIFHVVFITVQSPPPTLAASACSEGSARNALYSCRLHHQSAISLAHTKPATSPPGALFSRSSADRTPSSIESGMSVSSVSTPLAASVYTPSSAAFFLFRLVIIGLDLMSQTAKE